MKTPNHIGNLAPTVEQLQAQIATLTAENERLRFALIQMMPDYAAFIEDAVDHGADETWVEECRQIAAYARAALQPKDGE